MSTNGPRWYDAEEITSVIGYRDAIEALRDALSDGLDPSSDPDRVIVPVTNGQLLLMPSQAAAFAGAKLASVAPANPRRGLPRIQGVYLLLDAETLAPLALLDGSAVTTLRTPAVSALAADLLAPAEAEHLVVFGTGPQARGHIEALLAVRRFDRISVVARNPDRAARFATSAAAAHDRVAVRAAYASAVAEAQVVVCATSAQEPLFDGALVPDDACVVAMGSHEPDVREVDERLVTRAQVVVEDVATACREAGDVSLPMASAAIDRDALTPLAEVVRGAVAVDRSRPRLFKSVGMAWEDLVVAAAVHTAAAHR